MDYQSTAQAVNPHKRDTFERRFGCLSIFYRLWTAVPNQLTSATWRCSFGGTITVRSVARRVSEWALGACSSYRMTSLILAQDQRWRRA